MVPSCSWRRRVTTLALCSLLTAPTTSVAPFTLGRAQAAEHPWPAGQPPIIERAAAASLEATRGPVQTAGSSGTVGVIVELEVAPLARVRGDLAARGARPGLARAGLDTAAQRSAFEHAHLLRLAARLDAFESAVAAAIPGARTVHRYTAAVGGVAMIVPRYALTVLATLDGVRAVRADALLEPQTDTSVALIGARRAWEATGGAAGRGQGVLVGVLDTGIWPEHPCFSDVDTDADAAGVDYPPLDSTFACELDVRPGVAPPCNGKLVGARRFLAMHDNAFPPGEGLARDARDEEGHGTHTAAIATCNEGTRARVLGIDRGMITGVAPRARLIAYKVCGSAGCFASDVVAAVDRAILDGVDVINFSVSGGRRPFRDAVSLAFLDAYEAGIFVAASAGNQGPAGDTVDHRGAWVTSVAATTSNRGFVSALTLRASGLPDLRLEGAGLTAGLSAAALVVVPSDDRQCSEALGGVESGALVVCDRGSFARVAKGYHAAAAGASAMILRNLVRDGVAADSHHLPAVHLEFDAGAMIDDYLASAAPAAVTATIAAGEARPAQRDVVAPFSARGGPGVSAGVVKPDLAAPGVQILSAQTPEPRTPAVSGPAGELFQALQGTSMASPHVAGAAALLKGAHPDWGPGRIKSALLLTARTLGVTVGAGDAAAGVHDRGAGRVNLRRALDPGLSISASAAEYRDHLDDPWNANHPSVHLTAMPGRMSVTRRLRSESDETRSWRLRLTRTAGVRARVRPRRVELPPGAEVAVRVRLNASELGAGAQAELDLVARAGGGRRLRAPLALTRADPPVELSKVCEPETLTVGQSARCRLVVRNTTLEPARAVLKDAIGGPVGLVPGSVRGAKVVGSQVRARAALAPAAGVVVTVEQRDWRFGYRPLSLYPAIVPLQAVLDDEIVTVVTPEILFGGHSYARVGFASNGFVVLGGAGPEAARAAATALPDPSAPNAVIAPCWTDLDPSVAGELRVHTLANAQGRWTVFDWENVASKSGGSVSCQVWFGHNGFEEVAFAYGEISPALAATLTVGAEDAAGLAGDMLFSGASVGGPWAGLEVSVATAPAGPGSTHVVEYQVQGVRAGTWRGCARMQSDAFDGTTFACAPIAVIAAP